MASPTIQAVAVHCTSAGGEHNRDLYLKQRDLQMGRAGGWVGEYLQTLPRQLNTLRLA